MNVEQMTNRLQEIMQRAIMIANSNHNPQLCVEHVLKALNSDEVKKFIEDKYDGSIVPAF